MADIVQKPLFISPVTNSANIDQDDDFKIRTELEKTLQDKKILYTGIYRSKEGFYIIKLQEGGEAWISPQKDIDTQISSLQFILSRLTMEGKQFSRLDLRFEKPVIILNN